MIRAMQYSFDEALHSLWRGRKSGIMSTGTIALALFVFAAFLLVTTNLERLGAEWSTSAEMSVYLKDDVTAEERAAIERALQPSGAVVGHEYVSKGDAAARFKQIFGDLAATLDNVGDNPLPASYEVRLRTGSAGNVEVESLIGTLTQIAGVAEVKYDRQWLDRILSAAGIVRGVGWTLGILMTLAAALTVGSVVRLTLHSRREELAIMELVGAPQAYVSGPFVMEGTLQGGVGALTAVVALGVAYLILRNRYLAALASAVNVSPFVFLSPLTCVALVTGGMAVGCLGGWFAASQADAEATPRAR